MRVDVRILNRKTEKEIKQLFNHEAGRNLEEAPPMTTFEMDDSDEFTGQT